MKFKKMFNFKRNAKRVKMRYEARNPEKVLLNYENTSKHKYPKKLDKIFK